MGLKRRVARNRSRFPPTLRLTESEALVGLLLAAGGPVSIQYARTILYPCLPEALRPDIGALRVFINSLRNKFRPLDLEIETLWGHGWQMTAGHARRLRELMPDPPQEKEKTNEQSRPVRAKRKTGRTRPPDPGA